ncbi:hypothetical protein M9H77_31422 [Catharanthus roseus]|uniref:Uncharacterized protein n=1 Tax=Catharanthus roseus TaxID=4058 RepID=A0ACC0A015_CATRO|nr:hypothetical protein M9H77_31422 [Catharanthus roseus]
MMTGQTSMISPAVNEAEVVDMEVTVGGVDVSTRKAAAREIDVSTGEATAGEGDVPGVIEATAM